MAFFRYVARNKYGESIKGKVEAQNISQAASELSSRELLVIDIHPMAEDSFGAIKAYLFGVKQGDIVNFTRQLSTMVTAGLPLANALSILVRQSKAEVSQLVASLLQEIEGGSTFSKALAAQKKIFSRIYIQLVNAGETGGVMDQVLERLAENLEKERDFRGKTRGAMIYPVIVMLSMVVVGGILMVFVIPKLTEMYKDFGAELPLPTQILIALSNFFSRFWYLVVAGIAVGFLFFAKWKKTQVGDRVIDRFLFRLPIMGELRKKVLLTEFSRTMSLLIGSGVSLLQSLEIVTQAVESIIYRDDLVKITTQVEKGVSLSEAISQHESFPPILHQMIGVGEETGKLDEVLMKISKYFESESEQAVKNLTTAIEPMIMIVLGIGVGGMVMAVIMPIYNLTAQF
jgi:type IV pilus assembly protein PilC